MRQVHLAALWGGLFFMVVALAGCGDFKPLSSSQSMSVDEQQRLAADREYWRQVRKQEQLKREWIARGSPPSTIRQ